MVSVKEIERKLQIPEWLAWLDVISWCEGANYNTFFGGSTFSDFSRHPLKVISKSGYKSSAAGRYQIMDFNWHKYKNIIPVKDFTPHSQDIMAVYFILVKRRVKAEWIENITASNINRVLNILSHEWASFPPSRHGQPTKSKTAIVNYLNKALAARKSGQSIDVDDTELKEGVANQTTSDALNSNDVGFTSSIVMLLGNNNCEEPEYTQKSFLSYAGCLNKVESPRLANLFQMGATAPAIRLEGESDLPLTKLLNNPEIATLPLKGDLGRFTKERLNVYSKFREPSRTTATYFHKGTDLTAPVGTKIYSPIDGIVVVDATQPTGAGRHINIETVDRKYRVNFFHLSQVNVKLNQKVKRGQKVAESGGASGALGSGSSSGPHIHVELRVNKKLVDPADWFIF